MPKANRLASNVTENCQYSQFQDKLLKKQQSTSCMYFKACKYENRLNFNKAKLCRQQN